MSAYRGGKRRAERAADGNLVDQIVSQFADRFAFVRELVQNGIDAGAKHLEVSVDEGETTTVRVEDDGAGMTLDVIEGPLLTLFSSSKEGVAGKIGRYGVGFMSVFALDPEEVIVETHRREGAYRVRLGRDHAFEVFEAAARPGSGTTVSLVLRPADAERQELPIRVLGAARRWCRHVRPRLRVTTAAGTVAINEPFELTSPVVVTGESGGSRAIVGASAGTSLLVRREGAADPVEPSGDYAGFFAHGLTLLETSEPPTALAGVRFKIESPRLSHTISRDDVKRDDAFADAMRLVKKLARDELPEAIRSASIEGARQFARDGDIARFGPVLAAAAATLPRDELPVPLLEPMDGAAEAVAGELGVRRKRGLVLARSARSVLTRGLAARGWAIVRIEAGVEPAASAVLASLGLSGLRRPEETHAAIERREAETDGERLLLERIGTIFTLLGRRVGRITMGRVVEGTLGRAGLFLPERRDGWLWPDTEGPGRLPTLVLLDGSAVVARASQREAGRAAAALLGRLLLIEAGDSVSGEESDRLMDAAIEVGA